MSDQQMQFADPEWQPPQQRQQTHEEPDIPQSINNLSTEQTYQQVPPSEFSSREDDYARGYRAHQTQQQSRQPTFKQTPRARSSPWFWIIIVLLLLMIFGGGPFVVEAGFAISRAIFIGLLVLAIVVAVLIYLFRGNSSTNISTSNTHTFQVGQHPRIVIKNDRGSIRVQPGEGQEVRVEATRQSMGWSWMSNPSEINVSYNQNLEKNRVTVKAESGWILMGNKSVDFVITVPPTSDLELKTDAGNISVTAVNGQMSLTSDAGSVKASEVLLQGDSRLKTDAGSITFAGSIDPFGTYQFVTDAGSVNVTLPEQASFQLEAKTDVGSFNSDFPVDIRRDFPGIKARGEVGIPPYPKLKLKTDIGSINLRKGSF